MQPKNSARKLYRDVKSGDDAAGHTTVELNSRDQFLRRREQGPGVANRARGQPAKVMTTHNTPSCKLVRYLPAELFNVSTKHLHTQKETSDTIFTSFKLPAIFTKIHSNKHVLVLSRYKPFKTYEIENEKKILNNTKISHPSYPNRAAHEKY